MFKRLKEILGDPKKKALFQLSLYAVFFLIAFLIMSIGTEYRTNNDYMEEKNEQASDTKLKDISYDYEYQINDNNKYLNIKGNSNENNYYYNEINCYNDLGKTYSYEAKEELDFYFDNKLYNYNTMESLINLSDFKEKTTYKNDSEKTTYEISYETYLNLISGDICKDSNCKNMIEIVVFKEKYINHISIDLSKYYNYQYTVDIYYSNILGGNHD